MTRQTHPELLNNVLQLLTDQGLPGFAEGIRLLVDEAMRLERCQVLQAQPYERTPTVSVLLTPSGRRVGGA
jgi:hypothetical protein